MQQNDEILASTDFTEPLMRTSSVPNIDESSKSSNHRSSNGNHRNSNGNQRKNTNFDNTRPKIQNVLKYSKSNPNSVKWTTLDESETHPDITAMSVISLYQNGPDLDDEMDTNRDLMDESLVNTPTPTSIIIDKPKTDKVTNPDVTNSSQCANDSNNSSHVMCPKPTIYFSDGVKSVDFVLVWDSSGDLGINSTNAEKRKIFEQNLLKEGLELEYERPSSSGLNFIKVHAPKEVLRRYSEILKLRMPMKEEHCRLPVDFQQTRFYKTCASYLKEKLPGLQNVHQRTNFIIEGFSAQWEKVKNAVLVDKKKFPEKGHRFTAIYSRDREYLFDVDSPCFFTPAIHSRIVQFILDRKRFTNDSKNDFGFGIERLLNDKAYVAAYPLHDGDLRQSGSMRHLLYMEWTSIRKWYRYQPLDYVKEYFGVKIALYFAWLGFYTHMLIPVSLIGLACFIYSCLTLYNNTPSEDICNSNLKMCPLCDHWCDYWNLNETCVHARITYLFDNGTTVIFAMIMSIWATIFLELWKRYSAEITHRWDLTGFDIQEEHPRPQYLARLAHVKNTEVNIVTDTAEPRVPFWRMKVPATILSFSVVLLLVALAVATVVAVVLYRMSVLAALRVYGDEVTTSYAILFTTTTAACINLCFIFVFNWIYTWVAEYLTELELLRTQTEFDDSLTLKIYLLQFVNYYASIFYIAFFKGKFIGSPKKYNKIFGFRQEECGPGGCLMELCIQLGIIMIGKQAMNTALEMIFPLFYKWLNTLKIKTGLQKDEESLKGKKQWVKDFKLVDWGPRSLFPEYLEMILQYGFVTIFVSAFPLAPLFALLNNILEMRLDARKLLTFYRRPVAHRVRDIGVWYRILDSIGKLSVVTNGFIIAFTSDFIPKLVYRLEVSDDLSLNGYLNYSLSYFNTSDFQAGSAPTSTLQNYSVCRYPDYREPPWSQDRYEVNSLFWHILAARFAFVVVFENVAVFVMILVKWCIPDIPSALKVRIRKEAFITNEIIIQQETKRSQSGSNDKPSVIDENFIKNSKPYHTLQMPKLRTYIGNDCPTTPEHWDQLINKTLSGSEFDLIVHHPETFPKDGEGSSAELKPPTTV